VDEDAPSATATVGTSLPKAASPTMRPGTLQPPIWRSAPFPHWLLACF